MSKPLTVELPDEVYEAVQRGAEQRGVSATEVVSDALAWLIERGHLGVPIQAATAADEPATGAFAEDPLMALFGTLTCDVIGFSDQHDEWVGRAIAEDQ